MSWDIRQEWPLPGKLYTLAMEPFLGLLCRRLQGSLLECLCERLWVGFTVGMFIMGYSYLNKEKAKCVLLN